MFPPRVSSVFTIHAFVDGLVRARRHRQDKMPLDRPRRQSGGNAAVGRDGTGVASISVAAAWLRRSTDALRGVLERTRGDLTMAIRQDQMRIALQDFGGHLDNRLGTHFASDAEAMLEISGTAGNEAESTE